MSPATLHIAYDDVTISLIPKGATDIGVYINGPFENLEAVRKAFPNARLHTISTTDDGKIANWYDCETGDLTPQQAAACAKRDLGASTAPRDLRVRLPNGCGHRRARHARCDPQPGAAVDRPLQLHRTHLLTNLMPIPKVRVGRGRHPVHRPGREPIPRRESGHRRMVRESNPNRPW